MSDLNREIDEWFLGKTRSVKTIDKGLPNLGKQNKASNAANSRYGSNSNSGNGKKPLPVGVGARNLQAAAFKHPEVMIKIAKRKSTNSNGMRGIRKHLAYISRNGKLELENEDGLTFNGTKDIHSISDDWRKSGIDEDSKYKEALNIILSMPEGTNAQAVKNAAREFASEQFDGHQYLFTQHTDQKHPHVHICVLMRDNFGKRMNPRKNDLFEWRVRFAEKLREQGVVCAATRRQHRGITQKPENSFLKKMRERKVVSEVITRQVSELMEALENNEQPKHLFLKEAMQTRGILTEEYGQIAKELYKLGSKTEARIISQLAKELEQSDFKTEAQQKFDVATKIIKHSLDNDIAEHIKPSPNNDYDMDR